MKRIVRLTLYGSAAACGALLLGANLASASGGDEGEADTGQSQSASVENQTDQYGEATVSNEQTNLNVPVAVYSPGSNGGDVSQSNTAENTAVVDNDNATAQSAEQAQSAAADAASGGTAAAEQWQEASVDNDTWQEGDASVTNHQVNVNAPVAVFSPGSNNGDVSQSNTAENTAVVDNDNATAQSAEQAQSAEADAASGGTAAAEQWQEASVDNDTYQYGGAEVDNLQVNVNAPIAVGSPGSNNGDVEQSNTADNTAVVANDNATVQSVEQAQSGSATADGHGQGHGYGHGHHGGDAAVSQGQVAWVDNTTWQSGSAEVGNVQVNVNAPIAIGSPGANNGDVSQSNSASNTAIVSNDNATEQVVDQSQTGAATAGSDARGYHGGGGDASAIVSQSQHADLDNYTDQYGEATVDNDQRNVNTPVAKHTGYGKHSRHGKHGDGHGHGGGDVSQSNDAANVAAVANDNSTAQWVGQHQDGAADANGGDGSGHRHHSGNGKYGTGGDGGDASAVVGQYQEAVVDNDTYQSGYASVGNDQRNTNAPSGPSGDVSQSNSADNTAVVANHNDTVQSVGQYQAGTAEASGGDASNGGRHGGKGSYKYGPGKHGYGGHGGDAAAVVEQSQSAAVYNDTEQGGDATVDNRQANTNEPEAAHHKGHGKGYGYGKHGKGGHHGKARSADVSQSNTAYNTALVANGNATDQSVWQSQVADALANAGSARAR